MDQQLRVLADLPEDLSFSPSTQVGQLTTTCNFISRGSDALFCPLKAPVLMCIHNETQCIYIYYNRKSLKIHTRMTSGKLCKLLKMTFLILSVSSILLAMWSYGMADTTNGLQICPLLSEQNNFCLSQWQATEQEIYS